MSRASGTAAAFTTRFTSAHVRRASASKSGIIPPSTTFTSKPRETRSSSRASSHAGFSMSSRTAPRTFTHRPRVEAAGALGPFGLAGLAGSVGSGASSAEADTRAGAQNFR